MEILGYISKDEKNRMLIDYEKIFALEELLKAVEEYNLEEFEREEIKKSINEDLKCQKREYLENWNEIIQKYKWNVDSTRKLNLNFYTNEVNVI